MGLINARHSLEGVIEWRASHRCIPSHASMHRIIPSIACRPHGYDDATPINAQSPKPVVAGIACVGWLCVDLGLAPDR